MDSRGQGSNQMLRSERAVGSGKKRGIYVEKKEKIQSSDVESDAPSVSPAASAPPARRYRGRARSSAESLVVLKRRADIAQTPSLFSSYTQKDSREEQETTEFVSAHNLSDARAQREDYDEEFVDDDHPIRFGLPAFEIRRSDNIFIPVPPARVVRARPPPPPPPPRRPRKKLAKQSKEHLLKMLQNELRSKIEPVEPPSVYQVLCNLAKRNTRREVGESRRCGHRRQMTLVDEVEWPSETSLVVYDYE